AGVDVLQDRLDTRVTWSGGSGARVREGRVVPRRPAPGTRLAAARRRAGTQPGDEHPRVRRLRQLASTQRLATREACTMRKKTLITAVSVLLALTLAAVPSRATFRGPNGRLAFEAQEGANRQLFTIDPDGTGLKQITHFKDSGGTNAAWSKNGTRIV